MYNFDDVSKMAIQGLFKTKISWNKRYDVIIYVHYVTNKILSRDSNYIADVVMWPEFGNSSISTREVITTSISYGFEQNLGLALGMALKFYISVEKGLKLKVRKFCWLIPTVVEVTGEKLAGGFFAPLIRNSWIGLTAKSC